MNLTKEEIKEWMIHPTTVKVLKSLSDVRKEYQDSILEGRTVNIASSEQTALLTTKNLGIISGINLILEMDLE
mgnify:CR=1 FL=1